MVLLLFINIYIHMRKKKHLNNKNRMLLFLVMNKMPLSVLAVILKQPC